MSSRKFRSFIVAPLLLTGASGAAGGTTSQADCEAAAYRIYNSCLMSSDNYWHRILCDLAFEFNVSNCVRK